VHRTLLDSTAARPEAGCSGHAASQFAESQTHWNFNRRDQSAPATLGRLEQTPNSCFFFTSFAVVAQYFEVQVYDQFAIRGNAAIFKCQVPSFVADHVDVVGWIDSNGGSYVADAQSYGSKNWRDARSALYIVFSFMNWQITNFVWIRRRSSVTTSVQTWKLDRSTELIDILHALSTVFSFSPNDTTYHVCLSVRSV